LLKYTAQRIKADLSLFHPNVLEHFLVKAKDRRYQFWERNSLSVDLYTRQVFDQKLSYIHWNPVKAGLCKLPSDYRFSSANYYQWGIDEFGLLPQT
jgi:hypothetical protein